MSDATGMGKKPIDALTDEQRILGESRMIRDPDPKRITTAQAADVIDAVLQLMARRSMTRSYVGRAIGYSASVLSEVLGQKYRGDWQQVISDLDRWLEDELKAEAAPKPTEFVKTRVAEDVLTAADTAIALKSIGLVYGGAGLGKTLALRAVAAEKPGSVLISVETIASSAAGVITAIAHAMRIVPSARGVASSRHSLALIKEKLIGTPRLLIVDEAHKLCNQADDKALHALRDLHVATGCPMLWCATNDLKQYLDQRRASGRGKEPLSQISRRIAPCIDLAARCGPGGDDGGEDLFSVDEIRKVYARSKMRLAPDAARYLCELANLPDCGHLGACTYLVVIATQLNKRSGDVLTADMLRSAQSLLANQWAARKLDEARSRRLQKVG